MTPHSFLFALLVAAVAAYAAALVLALASPRTARGALAVGIAVHLAWLAWRGIEIGFFPLTNRAESLSAAALALAIVAFAGWVPSRAFLTPQLLLATLAGLAAAVSPQQLHEPAAILRTLWYPLHVPLSFLALGTWIAAAGAGLSWRASGERIWLQRTDRFALQGFGLWSAAMIFGGIWGVKAWGAYFMWDPKMIWSVLLWFHYAAFVHLRLAPSLTERPWVRPALAWVGVVWMFIAYVGTSFLFGDSSHAF